MNTLLRFTSGCCETRIAVVDSGSILALVTLLGSSHSESECPAVIKAALKTINRIVMGSVQHKQLVFEARGMPVFAKLLDHTCFDVVVQSGLILSRIVTGTSLNVEPLFTLKVVEPLINDLTVGDDCCKKRAVDAILLIMEGTRPLFFYHSVMFKKDFYLIFIF